MKWLLDENLSGRIVPFLQSAFPGSTREMGSGIQLWSSITLSIFCYSFTYFLPLPKCLEFFARFF